MIEALQAENGAGDMDGALALARALRRDIDSLSVYVFTDDAALSLPDAALCAVGEPGENRALLDATMQPESATAFARLKNYGMACETTLECYADGALCDVRTVSVGENEETGVRFSVPETAETVEIRIADEDALAADNVRYAARQTQAKRTALLVTGGNIFLERALGLDGSLTIDLAALDDAQTAAEYDLYVYERRAAGDAAGDRRDSRLTHGREVLGISTGNAADVSSALRAAAGDTAREICRNLLLEDIAIRKAVPLSGGTPVLRRAANACWPSTKTGRAALRWSASTCMTAICR